MHLTDLPRRLATTLAAAAFLLLLITTPAHAGVATIYQCRGPQGQADTDLMSAAGNSSLTMSFAGCASTGARLVSTGYAGLNPAPNDMTLTIGASGGTRFVGGTLYRQMFNYAYVEVGVIDKDSYGFGYELRDASSNVIERCGRAFQPATPGDCAPAIVNFTTGDYTRFSSPTVALDGTSTRRYTLTVGCNNAPNCTHYYSNPGIDQVSARLLVEDAQAPTDTAVTGPLATSDVIGGGDETLTVTASDPDGLGVYQAELLVDDVRAVRQTASLNGGKCVDADTGNANPYEFLNGSPCPAGPTSTTLSVAALPEGLHNLKVKVYDAAGNATVAMDRDVTIDRVAAPTNTSAPDVTGTAEVGRTLVATTGAWDVHGAAEPAFGYQWQRCDAAGASCQDVAGATGGLYDVAAADVGSRMRVRVAATNSEGTTSAPSAVSPVVVAKETATTGGGGGGGGSTTGGGGTTTSTTTTGGGGSGGGGGLAPATVQPGTESGLPVAAQPLGPEVRPSGTPNGANASEQVTLLAFDAASERRAVRVRYGRPVIIAGRLVAASGAPISGARLEVHQQERRAGAKLAHDQDILTDANGKFRYVAPAGPSRMVRVGYRARVGDTSFARTTDVHLKVVASVSFRLSRSKLRNGQTLRYLGRIHGPRTGHRFVEVVVRSGSRWQVVCSVRTDTKGSFGCAHRFRRTYRGTTYTFRARVRKQTGMPYEPGLSGLRKARVRP
ncbi:MAG: hypothetical protein HZB46_07980 [Solirubrobacterales bacterium]|nr:hypothetical protein [Solirubrobacterales bacterium]